MIQFNFSLMGFYFANVVILLLISLFIFFHESLIPNEVGDGMLAQNYTISQEGKIQTTRL